MPKTVFFDIGETLIEADAQQEALMAAHIEALAASGFSVDAEQYRELEQRLMRTFVPSAMHAVTWHFCKPHVGLFDAVTAELCTHYPAIRRHPSSLYRGVAELLSDLSRSYVLALAGNAPSSIRDALSDFGVLQYFTHTTVSGDVAYKKPDPRFFQTMLAKAGTSAEAAVMVGDRLDNDMLPARSLGMATIWVRQGHYSMLEPRTPSEIPAATVEAVADVGRALATISRHGQHDIA